MSRLFAREEWRLAAAGVLAGLLTAAIALFLWFQGTGVGPALPPPADTPGDTAGDPFVGALRRQVAQRLNSRPVRTRPLTGGLRIRAQDVAWVVPGSGERFVRAAAVTGVLDVGAANRGDVVLRDVRLERPQVALRSNGRSWNYERPLAGLLSEDAGPERRGGPAFRIQGLVIANGAATVDMPDSDFAVTGLDARFGLVELAGPGLAAPRMELITASATLDPPGERPSLAITAENGALRFPDRVTEFQLAEVTIEGTRIEALEGSWNPAAPGYGVTATGRAPSVQLADVQFLAPERIPDEGTASFRFSIRPVAGEGTSVALTELTAASSDSRISGSLAAEVFPGRVAIDNVDLRLEPVSLALAESILGRELPYGGSVSGTVRGPGTDIQVDLVASLTSPGVDPFNVALLGGVTLTREGLQLRELRAQLRGVPLAALRPIAPGLPFTGRVTGTVTLNGSPETTPLGLDVRLELGTGLATVEGTLDLTGAVARYDVSGRLVGIELQSVIENSPPVALTAQFALAGSGLDPARANARVRLDGRFSGWQAEAGDTLALRATVADGRADVQQLRVALAGASLVASGQSRFVEPISGAVEYRLAVASLEPFGPYLPVIGDSTATGALQAEGTISGPLSALRLAGELDGENLRVGEWGAARLESTYTVAFTGALPELELQLTGSDVLTPTAGDYRALTAQVRLVSPIFSLDVRGNHVNGGEVAVLAEGTIPREGSRTINLQRAFFDLQEGRWELAGPARITWGGDAGLRVADFELRNPATEGRVALDGLVFPLDRLDARLAAANLPLDQIQNLLGMDPRVTGRLWADLSIRPPAASPTIEGTFRLEGGAIDSVRFSQLEGRIDYAGGVARTELVAAIDTAGGRFELRGTIPLEIAFADSLQFGLGDTGPLDATLIAQRISLRPLGAFVTRVRDLEGTLDGTITLGGTAQDPRLGGQLALSGGHVVVPDLNQAFDSIAGVVAFTGRQAEFRDVRLFRDGWARLNGTATFEELDRPVFALVADLDEFQPMGVEQHPDAAVSGRVTLEGELESLVLSGNVTIDDGYLAVPQFGRAFDDEYVDILDPTPVPGVDAGERGSGTWLSNLRIVDLRARFGEGAWFEAMEATAQLSGDLTINRVGEELRVVGTLEGERGTYVLSAGPIVRRFEVIEARVRFLGQPEPNPAIDITARRTLLDETGRRVEIDVRITGTMETPRLSLASADAPEIAESELISFLLFGRPSFELGQDITSTGTELFEQTFLGGVAEFASIELERSLSGDLGLQLDLFQVQFGQGLSGIAAPTVVVGRQLSNDFFLTLETGLGALFGEDGATANTWAIRLEWAIDRRSSLRAGYEPVNRARLLRGFGAALPPGEAPRQQLFFEYRRRWVY